MQIEREKNKRQFFNYQLKTGWSKKVWIIFFFKSVYTYMLKKRSRTTRYVEYTIQQYIVLN